MNSIVEVGLEDVTMLVVVPNDTSIQWTDM
jgi:hypothetical protein